MHLNLSKNSENNKKIKKPKKRKLHENENDNPILKNEIKNKKIEASIKEKTDDNFEKLKNEKIKRVRKDSAIIVDINEEEKKNDDPGSFDKFNLTEETCLRLKEMGVNKLFPVQYKSYKYIYKGKDVILQSRTGSGKTLSFVVPVLEKLKKCQFPDQFKVIARPPKVLVMTPTRELSRQVADCFEKMVDKFTKVLCVYGGVPIFSHETSLKQGIDILVGTPGRIQDLINRNSLFLHSLSHVILDEVDRMLDMGFADDVDNILKCRYEMKNSTNPQTLLFSATLPEWVRGTASKYLSPKVKHINLMEGDSVRTSKTVQHLAIQCSYQDRASTIDSVIKVYSGTQGRVMIFCRTKKDADELVVNPDVKVSCQVIHGDITQEKRELVLKGFREGKCRCLIATDVAARGLDIPEVDLVIQCSPPQDVESYIHRSGRTGRAGRQGTCVLFFKRAEEWEMRMVEQKAKIKFRLIGAPTNSEIILSMAREARLSLDSVSEKVACFFEATANEMLEEKGAVHSLSRALAVICGHTEIKQRSLLNSREGLVTFLFRTCVEIKHYTYVWTSLSRSIPENIRSGIQGMRFCKDRKGVVFDVPFESTQEMETRWKGGRNETLTRAESLPELEDYDTKSSNSRTGPRTKNFFQRTSNNFQRRENRNFSNFRGRTRSSDINSNNKTFSKGDRRYQ